MPPGIPNEDRYARQRMLAEIGKGGQEKLQNASVVIIGCGALGSVQAELLARAGLGGICIADRDVLEESNLPRQFLFDEDDLAAGLPKAEAAARRLSRINASIRVEAKVLDVTTRNIEALIEEADLVLDGTDNLETRYLINDACVKAGIPWIYGGAVGTAGMCMTILPKEGPCFRCLFPDPPGAGTLPTCETHGVLNAVTALIASFQVAEALKCIVGQRSPDPKLLSVDLWKGTVRHLQAVRDEDCPCCGLGRFDFLTAAEVSWTTSLCGRNAVQITPARETRLPFDRLRVELEKAGKVIDNGLLLRFEAAGHELLIFPDGRVIVKGTADEALARSLYARYLGH